MMTRKMFGFFPSAFEQLRDYFLRVMFGHLSIYTENEAR